MMKKLIRTVAGVAFIAAAAWGAVGVVQDPGWSSAPAEVHAAPLDPGWSVAPALLGDPGWSVAPAQDPGWS
ncbi:hypothetical protein R1T08_21775 [Streptomyces sp. SBC-4]|nr:hypothetical protein [Streptomyces sp. SBC-4]MDV5146745.1 hypothetical protein [Streptomyces sp. SBC-4]